MGRKEGRKGKPQPYIHAPITHHLMYLSRYGDPPGSPYLLRYHSDAPAHALLSAGDCIENSEARRASEKLQHD